jgi:hypothetical protein
VTDRASNGDARYGSAALEGPPAARRGERPDTGGGPGTGSRQPHATPRRQYTLRQAAALIFSLLAALPLLLFVWAVHALGAISTFYAEVGLTGGLVVALLGYRIFRSLMTQMSELIGEAEAATRHRLARTVQPRPAPTSTRPSPAVAGIPPIRELGELGSVVAMVWQTEAWPLVGRPVVVSLREGSPPITGRLLEVASDGLLVGGDEGAVAIAFRRLAAIEPAPER